MAPKTHVQARFSARAEIPFRLHDIFFRFSGSFARLPNQFVDYIERDSARAAIQPGLKILSRFVHVIDNLILRGFVSEARLKFQPG